MATETTILGSLAAGPTYARVIRADDVRKLYLHVFKCVEGLDLETKDDQVDKNYKTGVGNCVRNLLRIVGKIYPLAIELPDSRTVRSNTVKELIGEKKIANIYNEDGHRVSDHAFADKVEVAKSVMKKVEEEFKISKC